jgi:23S rRNA-/tRNA-specific pseudouridylate synthase
VGDELYGTKGKRLMLHAAEIWFTHPVKEVQMHLTCEMEDIFRNTNYHE